MASKNKTSETEVQVIDFINSTVDKEQKREDSFRLLELMQEWSGFEPRMWGPTIIGFGRYHYKYASGREGDAPLIGFSPRKAQKNSLRQHYSMTVPLSLFHLRGIHLFTGRPI